MSCVYYTRSASSQGCVTSASIDDTAELIVVIH